MKTQSLREKLIKIQLSMTTIVLLISWIFISIDDYFIFKSISLEKFESTAKILSRNLGTCLSFKDKDECERVLNTLNLVEGIYQVVVIEPSNEIFSSYTKKDLEVPRHTFQSSGKGYEYQILDNEIISSYPILENGNYEGRLYIVAEFNMMRTFGKRHAVAFVVIMLGSVLLAFVLFNTLQVRITGQMKLMLKTIHKIRMDKSYSLRVQDEKDWKKVEISEFQQLGESFDSMIEQVELRDYSMKKQNEDLEKIIEVKVQEVLRSAELASLGEMAGGIAHEINNPLTIIKSTNRVLIKMIDKDNLDKATFKEFLTNVDMTVDRIAKIVTGLRNISRKSDDKDIAACTYNEIFTDVFDVADAKFKSKGIELRKSYTPEEAATTFMANRIQLCQVLVNLLNNSFDAIIDLPDLDKWIEIKISIESDKIALYLIDSGQGIPVKVRDKMFNPFFTTKEIGKGTGIGLAISKSMVEKMDGEFYYDDKVANTCFVISLKV